MDPATLAVVGSIGSGAGGAAITALVGRRLRRAQVRQITTEAHSQIYEAYGGILAEMRTELALSREEVGRYREELRLCRERGERMTGELAELRARLDAADVREQHLAAEVQRLNALTTMKE